MVASWQRMVCHAVLLSSWTVFQTSRYVTGLPIFSPRFSRNCGVARAFDRTTTFRNKTPFSFRLKTTTQDEVDLTNPDNWHSNTSPQDLIQAIAKEGVTESEIKNHLDKFDVTSLADLVDHAFSWLPNLVDKRYHEALFKLLDASRRIKKTVEEVLGGQSDHDTDCITQECLDSYAAPAVAVHPTAAVARKGKIRQKKFTLVMGPSGSGKTIFALKRLPILLFGDDDTDTKEYFSVHFVAENAYQRMMNANETFPDAVAYVVKRKIAAKLLAEKLVNTKQVNLYLHVIIDEAGDDSYQKLFHNASKIETIVDAVENDMSYKFLKGAHVTVAGTGLDATVTMIPPWIDTIKFRMQPWSMQHFKELAWKSQHSNPSLVFAAIDNYPILEDLISNARCACYLLMSTRNVALLSTSRVNDAVKSIVRSVADLYIGTNSLSHLNRPSQQFLIARSVLKELDKSTSQPGVAFFPQFDDLSFESYRSIAKILLDVHVESSGKELTLVDGNRFSLSLSPALVIIVVNLLFAAGDISWDWHAFESIVMLSELKRVIVTTSHTPRQLDRLVVQLQSPLPGMTAETAFAIPIVSNCTVILNAPHSGYADVIAPYRLVQVKFSIKDSIIKDLCLQEALDKMGLTGAYELNQFLTDVLYTKIWANQKDTPDTTAKISKSTPRAHRHECYPFDVLNSRRIQEQPEMIVGKREADGGWRLEGKGLNRRWSAPITFDIERPVVAVFATNCKAFQLTNEMNAADTDDDKRKKQQQTAINDSKDPNDAQPPGKKTKKEKDTTIDTECENSVQKATTPTVTVLISPEDVDCHGKLLDPDKIPAGLISGLRENVDVRFLFFGRH